MNYWYFDNWHGTKREFDRLDTAKHFARLEDGISITIWTMNNGREGIAAIVNTISQYCPA